MKRTRSDLLPLARALEVIGDPWSFLIVQEAFFGVRRFEAFQRNLGISRKTLADRLNRLQERGLLSKVLYEARPPRYEYRLTPSSRDTYAYALCLMRWGNEWQADAQGPPVVLHHKPCGHPLTPLAVCGACAMELRAADMEISPSTVTVPLASTNTPVRSSSRPELYTAGRPSSISRAVAVIGDRWGFFVLWLSLAGITRFDQFHEILGVARTVLVTRLDSLIDLGLFERRPYQERPPRYDYCLTAKGRALCPALLAMFDWSVRWHEHGASTASIHVLHRPCGSGLRMKVVCEHCREVVQARDVEVSAQRSW